MNHLLGFLVICLFVFTNVKCEIEEKASDSDEVKPVGTHVKVSFMDLKREEFMSADVLAAVKNAIANRLNEYCRESCGIDKRSNITADNIEFLGESDKEKFHEDGRYIIVKMNAKVENQLLSHDIMEQFMIAERSNIVAESKVDIAFVNDKLVYPKRDNLDNYIIISVSCAFTLVFIIINLICQRKRDSELKGELSNGLKKNEIYNPSKAEETVQFTQASPNSQVKNRNNKRSARHEEQIPLNVNEEEESVPGFPSPNQEPILTTSNSFNPNMRLTQV